MGNELKLGKVLIHLSNTQSTNDYIANMVTKNRPLSGTVVSTDFQSYGKGQFGNKWQSEAGKNLLLSVYIRPKDLKAADSFLLNIASTLAICTLLDHTVGRGIATIKWPNDILANGRKIAGILIQNSLSGQKVSDTIIGIGLNINQTQFLHDYGNFQPNSMALIKGRNLNRGHVLLDLLDNLEYYLNKSFEDVHECEEIFVDKLHKKEGSVRLMSKKSGKEIEGCILEIQSNGTFRINQTNSSAWLKIDDWKMLLNGQ